MSKKTEVDFFKTPPELVDLLGLRAAELLSQWFALAGYQNPIGVKYPLFSGLNKTRKAVKAVDADLVLSLGHYLTEDEETPSVNVRISLLVSGDLDGDLSPYITIAVRKPDGDRKGFTFHGGTWTIE